MAKNKKVPTTEEACLKMATLCARSEQSEFEIIRKLVKMSMTSSQRREVIDFLKEERYIDNQRFAKSYANDKAKFSGWGPLKIKAALLGHRISSSVITEAIDNIEPSIWQESIIKLASNKAKSLDLIGEDGRENRIKLYRYLLGRGFYSSMAVKAVGKIKNWQQEQLESEENEMD